MSRLSILGAGLLSLSPLEALAETQPKETTEEPSDCKNIGYIGGISTFLIFYLGSAFIRRKDNYNREESDKEWVEKQNNLY
ncbi:MAG: hypothetical protein Q8Q35_00655 [Nanoarchaeota archaeon]|nr:hypothetical protein [Nanoarchaeota archaeon]